MAQRTQEAKAIRRHKDLILSWLIENQKGSSFRLFGPFSNFLQQLSEQKQEINAPRKDLAAIQPTDPTTIKPDSDMAFVDSNTKVGYLS